MQDSDKELSSAGLHPVRWRVVGWPPSLLRPFRRLGRKAQRGGPEQGLEARRGSVLGDDQRLSIGPGSPATTCFLRASSGSPDLRVGLFASDTSTLHACTRPRLDCPAALAAYAAEPLNASRCLRGCLHEFPPAPPSSSGVAPVCGKFPRGLRRRFSRAGRCSPVELGLDAFKVVGPRIRYRGKPGAGLTVIGWTPWPAGGMADTKHSKCFAVRHPGSTPGRATKILQPCLPERGFPLGGRGAAKTRARCHACVASPRTDPCRTAGGPGAHLRVASRWPMATAAASAASAARAVLRLRMTITILPTWSLSAQP